MRHMQSIFRTARVLALAAVFAAGVAAQGQAAPIVSIAPASQTATIGDTVSIDILVSGLTEPTGGFSIQLSFDDSILAGDSFGLDPAAELGNDSLDFSGGFALLGGTLDLFLVAGTLPAVQSASFILATVSFIAQADGVSPITLDFADLSDMNGDSLLGLQTANGQVCVGGPCPVPEPGLLLLLSSGVAALVVRRQTSRRQD